MKYVEKYKLFIDNDCNVYSTDKNGRIYALPLWKCGAKKEYWRVAYYPVDENWNRLPNCTRQTKAYHHDIVNTAFNGEPPEDGLTTDHKDINGFNNNPDNLQWATRSEQQRNRRISLKYREKYGFNRWENPKEYYKLYKADYRSRKRPVKFADGSRHCLPNNIVDELLKMPRSQRVYNFV